MIRRNEREFKSYGLVRMGLYAVTFFFSAMFWMVLLLFMFPRLLPLLRIFSLFDLFLVFLLAGGTAFWVVNFAFFIPLSTLIKPGGFLVAAPFHRGGEVYIHFSELGTIFDLGFGTWITVHPTKTHGKFNLLFGKDTDGYYRLVDTLKDGLNEFRTPS